MIAKECKDSDSEASVEKETSTVGGDDSTMEAPPIKATTNKDPSALQAFTQKETVAVQRSKILVYVFLLVAAAGVGTATYFLSSKDEKSQFASGK